MTNGDDYYYYIVLLLVIVAYNYTESVPLTFNTKFSLSMPLLLL